MKYLMRFLRFVRLTDEQDNISITNILIIAMAVKIMLLTTADEYTLAAFILTLLHYSYKRHVNSKKPIVNNNVDNTIDEIKKELADQKDVINSVALKAGWKNIL